MEQPARSRRPWTDSCGVLPRRLPRPPSVSKQPRRRPPGRFVGKSGDSCVSSPSRIASRHSYSRASRLLTKVSFFKDIKKSLSPERQGPAGRGLHGKTITLSVPSSDACSATVDLSFRVGHDGPIENVILDYRLEILPIYIEFDSHDQLLIPIDNPTTRRSPRGSMTNW